MIDVELLQVGQEIDAAELTLATGVFCFLLAADKQLIILSHQAKDVRKKGVPKREAILQSVASDQYQLLTMLTTLQAEMLTVLSGLQHEDGEGRLAAMIREIKQEAGLAVVLPQILKLAEEPVTHTLQQRNGDLLLIQGVAHQVNLSRDEERQVISFAQTEGLTLVKIPPEKILEFVVKNIKTLRPFALQALAYYTNQPVEQLLSLATAKV